MGRADSWEFMAQTSQTISRIMVLATMFRERSEANVACFSGEELKQNVPPS
jgi:hypothetical protein